MPTPSFIPTATRARLATFFLVATIVVDVIAIGSDFWEISTINRFLNGTDVGTGPLASSDHRQAIMSALGLAVLALTAIVFIRWFYAAYRNVALLGTSEPRFKPGWAIGAWFVPFLSLWRPPQIADDIWNASEGEEHGRSNPLVRFWWSFWLLSLFVGNAAGRVVFNANTLSDIRDSAKFDIAGLTCEIAAAVLAIFVIRHITSRQTRWALRLGARIESF